MSTSAIGVLEADNNKGSLTIVYTGPPRTKWKTNPVQSKVVKREEERK